MKRSSNQAQSYGLGNVSHLESMSVHCTVAVFLEVQDLSQLQLCNQRLYKLYMPLFAARARWPAELTRELSVPQRREVRYVVAENADDLKWVPKDITHLDFFIDKPIELQLDVFSKLTSLTNFNAFLPVVTFPASLTMLKFRNDFDHVIKKGKLPDGLLSLHFGSSFNCCVSNVPTQLTELVLGSNFNQPLLIGGLPSSLTRLQLGTNFNQPLDFGMLPAGLLDLNLGGSFSYVILPGVLPSGLTKLDLGYFFNHPLSIKDNACVYHCVLPNSLIYLTLSGCYNQPIHQGMLSEQLTVLEFGRYFDHVLPSGTLPSGIKKLRLVVKEEQERLELPPCLTDLEFYYYNRSFKQNMLPSTLIRLVLSLDFNYEIGIGELPDSITELSFGYSFNQPLRKGVLPKSLITLSFTKCFNQCSAVFPDQLRKLIFGTDFNQILEVGMFPSTLAHLEFGDNFNQSIGSGVSNLGAFALPSSLTYLKLGRNFRQELGLSVFNLSSLTHLVFNGPVQLSPGMLPSSLTRLEVPFSSSFLWDKGVLPSGLKNLFLDGEKTDLSLFDLGDELI